jgi:hypothetical protein
MQLNELIKITNFEGRQVMYIDKIIVWITMRYTYIRKMLHDCKVANLQTICYVF